MRTFNWGVVALMMGSAGLSGLVPLVAGCNGGAGGAGGGGKVTLKTDQDKTFYALGLFEGQRVSVFAMTPEEYRIMQSGISDVVLGNKPQIELQAFQPKIQELFDARRKLSAEKQKEKSKAFLDTAAKESGAVKTASGLIYKEEKAGTGEAPKASDTVKVNYEGKLVDGTVFDSSYKRNQPAEFPLGGVIKCWTEGVGMMKVGGKAKLVCPADIAYGDRGSPPQVPGGATLIFTVELLEIKQPEAAPATPPGMPPGMQMPGHPQLQMTPPPSAPAPH